MCAMHNHVCILRLDFFGVVKGGLLGIKISIVLKVKNEYYKCKNKVICLVFLFFS